MIYEIIGNIFISAGVVLVFIGMVGFFRFRAFQSKLLAAASIDAMALTTILIGAMIRGGISWFTLKLILILAVFLVLNPISASKIALSARNERLREEKEVERRFASKPMK